jgi:hypothetical protein
LGYVDELRRAMQAASDTSAQVTPGDPEEKLRREEISL